MTTETVKRHKARGAATYRGDFRHIVGEIKGPTTYGELLVATSAEYDPALGTTRVTFSHATEPDIAQATVDQCGIHRTPLVAS